MSELMLVRHGETEWSRTGRHTGLTDIALTAAGETQAKAVADALAGRTFGLALVSPLGRARHTAELAGITGTEIEPDLVEWDYGGYEGITTDEIRESVPGWYLWRDGVIPGDAEHPGESIADVGRRVDRVLERARPVLAGGRDVVLVAHGHLLRVLTARWLGLPPEDGRLFRLETARLSTLGHERETPVLLTWNTP
ncbi:histidine phosphatase family protein [Streptomyces sp. SID3343]|uniref:histidine phosphatase family protein n=1 Tax=Streptomyces sp. SID3343 TaxID=2690260 RepID=UPI00136DA104|nr:histidine phosphatase family protein [Streptomyces sp. SID3343]MYW06368.1 histidine phosphatase family protein [Streptomyces sp. SID3343]